MRTRGRLDARARARTRAREARERRARDVAIERARPRASMDLGRAVGGLDVLLEALDASASIRIQTELERGAPRGSGRGKRARSFSTSAGSGKRSVLRDVTNERSNGGVKAPKTPAKGSMERGTRGGRRRVASPASEAEDERRGVSETEDVMMAGARILVSEHADVVIDRVRQWLDLLGGDVRGRLGALRRSEKRARAALEKFERKGVESDDVGMVYLRQFEETLKVERELLLQTLQRLEGMRNTVEFEAAKLALRWLDRSNRDMNDDDGTSDDENAAQAYTYSHSSSAYAFLCVALGAYGEDEAFAKACVDTSAATPSAVVDAARFFP